MSGADRPDLFLRLERELRTPLRPLPIDAFLPSPDAIPSSIPASAPAAAEHAAPVQGFVQQWREQEPPEAAEEPAPRPRKPRKPAQTGASKSLKDEIEEFMKRDGGALAPDVEPES
jgi:hypothetical protein